MQGVIYREGTRYFVGISNNFFTEKTGFSLVCPIHTGFSDFPLHVPLDGRTQTQGVILCERVQMGDVPQPKQAIEIVPQDILQHVINVIISQIEII